MQFGIIGGGVMAEAILSRLLAQNIYAADQVLVSEPQASRRDFLQETYGVNVTGKNQEAIAASEVVLLAIKPQVFDKVVSDLRSDLPLEAAGRGENPVILSILAGMPLTRLEAAFSPQPVIRVMPNTPATVGAGMTAISPGKGVTGEQCDRAKTIFGAVGEVVEVPEKLMDAVTGVSGSGPAFVSLMVEALSDGGVAAGLPRNIATQLAIQTVLGTAQLLQESGLHPAQLKDRVTSPGGTTIAGVAMLEKLGFRSATIEAVKAAYLRSQQLGK